MYHRQLCGGFRYPSSLRDHRSHGSKLLGPGIFTNSNRLPSSPELQYPFLTLASLTTTILSGSPKRICTANRPDLKVHTARKYHCGEQGLRYTHVRMTTLTIPFAMPFAPTPLLVCFLASAAPLGSTRRYHPAPRSVIFLLVPNLIP
jgi:hypothetical protein